MSRVSASAMRDTEDAVRRQIEDERRAQCRAQDRESDNATRQRQQAEESARRARENRACWCGRDHVRKEVIFATPNLKQRPARNDAGSPSARVYIGNLPFRSSDLELTSAFHDLVPFHFTCNFVPDGKGGHKGTAFLSFVSADRAAQAVELLDGHHVAGRAMIVAFAQGRRRDARDQSSRSERHGESGAEGRR